jgi:translation initiation factor 2 beta subunit (eIF-2beta)/eIF-5
MKVFEKFVVCQGCHKMSTINYTDKEYTKTTTCMVCGKISTYKIKPYENINGKVGRPSTTENQS